MKPTQTVICDYCRRNAELVTGDIIHPANPKTHGKHYWYCQPCDAWCACHENSPSMKPVGRLANAELREAKRAAHDAFDLLWMAGHQRMLRKRDVAPKRDAINIAYSWLSEQMGLAERVCHIGSFDLEQAKRARAICVERGNQLLMRYTDAVSK